MLRSFSMHFRGEADVVGQDEKWSERSYFLDWKAIAEPGRLLYLQLQVFHMQSLDYSAQGHSKCEVSEFQTEKNLKKEEIPVTNT